MLHDYIIYPLMAIVFTFDFYVFRVGRAMVQMPKDKEWKDVINGLLPIANSIIIRVSKTEGCKWEMQRCISTDYFDKVFLLFPTRKNTIYSRIAYRQKFQKMVLME